MDLTSLYLKGEGILSTDLLDLSFAESCWEDLRGDFVNTDGGYVGWLQVNFGVVLVVIVGGLACYIGSSGLRG